MTLGFGLVLLSVSVPLSTVGRLPATALEPVGRVCFGIGLSISALGMALMVFFNYWVFRRGSRWALALFAVIDALLVGSVAYISAMNFTGSSIDEIKLAMRPGTLTMLGGVGLAFAWAGAESLAYWRTSRRRLALGLADPVVTHRFLLWGIASATSFVLLVVVVACVLSGMTIMREPLPLAAMAASGCVMSASWYLTFLAPARYERFIRARYA
jgi:hypothetical protein